MSELDTYGSVGVLSGNRPFYLDTRTAKSRSFVALLFAAGELRRYVSPRIQRQTTIGGLVLKLEAFDDVLSSMKRNSDREFHLLLGNGFSMAYDPEIFSYNALHDFITNLDDNDLSIILGVIETKNFEVIMQQLDNFSALIEAFGGDKKLKRKVDSASAKLKTSLLEAVRALHPEHVFTVPEDQSAACSRFLKTFLDSGGNIFSTNYDLLLYWILMRNSIVDHCDGFGRELENPGEFVPPEEQIWSDLIWGKHREEQNVFYV